MRQMDLYKYPDGTELNNCGRPISSENITVVPPGPITHLTVLDARVSDLVAFPCINYNIKMNEISTTWHPEKCLVWKKGHRPVPIRPAASSSYLLFSFLRNLDRVFF